jgi:hypothetical protein
MSRSRREKALIGSRHSADPLDRPDARRETQMNILTVNLMFSTFVFAVAAKLYLIPMLPRLGPRSVVLPILLLHATRHLGLVFLAPGGVFPGLPGSSLIKQAVFASRPQRACPRLS